MGPCPEIAQSGPEYKFMRFRYLIPFAVLIVLGAIYYVAWQHSATVVREELIAWIDEERAAGRTADYESFTIGGFPYRMQIEITAPHLANPEAGWSWQAEKITGFVLPYQLQHAVLVVEGQQRIEFNRLGRREVITGSIEDERASLVLRGGDLERFSVEAAAITAQREIFLTERPQTPERVENIRVRTLQLHTRRVRDDDDLPATGDHHAVQLEADNITWNGHPYEGLGSDIAYVFVRVLAAGLPTSDIGPVASDFMEQWQANDGILYLDEAAIRWSEIEVGATGVFQFDNQHRPEGEMTILVSGHDRAIDALVAGGALDPQYADISKTVLDVIAAIGGDPEGRIRAPVRLEDGKAYIGPAELMDLPPLY